MPYPFNSVITPNVYAVSVLLHAARYVNDDWRMGDAAALLIDKATEIWIATTGAESDTISIVFALNNVGLDFINQL